MKSRLPILILTILTIVACDITRTEPIDPPAYNYKHTLIYCAAGFNDICSFLREDLEDIKQGEYLPPEHSGKCLVAITHFKDGSYSNLTPIHIMRIFSRDGKAVCDTLESIYGGALLTEEAVLRNALLKVAGYCPSETYGLILSSHGTGWTPCNCFDNFSSTLSTQRSSVQQAGNQPCCNPREYVRRDYSQGPPVKSYGGEVRQDGYSLNTIEMDIRDLKNALPFKLEYLLFDACYMGGVEVAYELRDKADKIGFSQTEILVYGFEYLTAAENLLHRSVPDPEAVCRNYYEMYERESGDACSATISLVDCTKLDSLAKVCGRLFQKYSDGLASVDATKVQRYFRGGISGAQRWFFDLEDILIQCGVSSGELEELGNALDACILYKAATKSFMPNYGGFDIKHFCGLSSYLPKLGNAEINEYYKTLEWNKASYMVRGEITPSSERGQTGTHSPHPKQLSRSIW